MGIILDKLTGNPLLIEVKESDLDAAAQAKLNKPYKHSFLPERYARTANRNINFTGTVRTVGSGKTYATLTAAYAAAVTGDIIEVYGTIDLTNEAGNYWLINDTKKILVRGAGVTPADTIITQSFNAGYVIRARITEEIVFQNLTLTTTQNAALLKVNNNSTDRLIVFNNCILTNTLNSILVIDAKTDTNPNWYEFKNCIVTSKAGSVSINTTSVNDTFIITNSTLTNNASGIAVELPTTYGGKIILYDNIITNNANDKVISIGNDVGEPTAQQGLVDIRNNTISIGIGYNHHALLLGRGTSLNYVANNKIYIPNVNNANNIGLVIKSVNTNVSNSLIEGNYITSPRPLLVKGGAYNTIQNNTFISNESNWEAFGFMNYQGTNSVLSTYNIIRYNNFVANTFGIYLYNSPGESQTAKTSILTCDINSNKYYCPNNYLIDGNAATSYSFADKSDFWGVNTNDNVSIELSLLNIPITY